MVGRLIGALPVPGFIRKRSGECMGVAFVIGGVLLAAALLTYHAGDPSWNQTGDAPATNALGNTGANIADLLKQTIGWMSALIVIALFGWSWRLIMKDDSV